jgi:hypothetical protein
MALSKKSFMGVAREATPGTAMTAPTLYIPTKSTTKARRKTEYTDEERGDRNSNYDAIDTIRWGEWDSKGPWYGDTCAYLLLGAMGGDTITQPDSINAPTAYKHTLGLADTPPSLTLFKNYDAALYYHPYSIVEKFGLKFTSDGKLLEHSTSGKSIFPTKYTGSTLTPSFSTVKPFGGQSPTITLNSGSTNDIDELSLDFEQKITLWNPANGSKDFTTVYFGERKVTVSFTARFDSDTLYNEYLNTTLETLTIDFLGPIIGGSVHQELNLQVPVLYLDEADHDLGKDNVLIKIKAMALSQGSGSGDNYFKAFVVNTIASYAS